MGEGGEGGADKAGTDKADAAAKEAGEKGKSTPAEADKKESDEKAKVADKKESDEKAKAAADGGKQASTPPPPKDDQPKSTATAKPQEPQKPAGDQAPAVLNKNIDPKKEQRIVVFKVPPEKKPVWSEIKIENPSNDQKTFKVKCTSADYFRVQPPLGLIKPNDTARIRVWFQNANGIPTDGKRHYFAVYYMNSKEGKTLKDMWTKDAKHEGICRINVQFEKKEGSKESGGGETKKPS